MPYLYTLFHHAATTGVPIVRPVFFADPKNPALRGIDHAFLLGAGRAGRRKSGTRSASLIASASLAGPRSNPADTHDPELPRLFIRPGAAVPMGPVVQHLGENAIEPLTWVAHLDNRGEACGLLYEDDGDGLGHTNGYLLPLTRWTIRRKGPELTSHAAPIAGTEPTNAGAMISVVQPG